MLRAFLFCLTLLPAALFAFNNEKIIWDLEELSTDLPRQFRTMDSPFRMQCDGPAPSRRGLNKLRISGSDQFSEKGFQALLKKLKNRKGLVIIDVRRESHGFMNGLPISWRYSNGWHNLDKPNKEISSDEQAKLAHVKKVGRVEITNELHKEKVKVKRICSEKELARRHLIAYLRIPVIDNTKPTEKNVDKFLKLIKKLPKDAWMHVHCQHGMGRTTIFLVMYDMIKNAKKVSFYDIITRQRMLGGMNFSKDSNPGDWNANYSRERRLFIRHFYTYCREQGPKFKIPWSKWCKSKCMCN